MGDGFEESKMSGVFLHQAKIHLFYIVLIGDNQQDTVVG